MLVQFGSALEARAIYYYQGPNMNMKMSEISRHLPTSSLGGNILSCVATWWKILYGDEMYVDKIATFIPRARTNITNYLLSNFYCVWLLQPLSIARVFRERNKRLLLSWRGTFQGTSVGVTLRGVCGDVSAPFTAMWTHTVKLPIEFLRRVGGWVSPGESVFCSVWFDIKQQCISGETIPSSHRCNTYNTWPWTDKDPCNNYRGLTCSIGRPYGYVKGEDGLPRGCSVQIIFRWRISPVLHLIRNFG